MKNLIFNNVAGALAIALVGTMSARGGSFDVPLDESRSRLTFELCITDRCDEDSSPVAGAIRISLDSIGDPSELTLWDFDMSLTESIDLSISWGFLGRFDATGTDIRLFYAFPGEPIGPAPIEGGSYVLRNVPTNSEGHMEYLAIGLPCLLLEGSGYPCEGAIELADLGTQILDEFSGSITVVDRVVTLTSHVDLTLPLDPENPDLGQMHVFGTVVGSVALPILSGDVDDDFDVDLDDHAAWVACAAGPGVSEPPDGCSAEAFAASDIDDDSDVDLADFTAMQGLIVGG